MRFVQPGELRFSYYEALKYRPRVPFALAITLSIVLICSCQKASPSYDKKSDCWVKVGSRMMFTGTKECMEQLPHRRISGVWVVGPEVSVLYEGASQVPSTSNGDVWLEADVERILAKHGVKFTGQTQAFRVDFIGTTSSAPGVYGHFGQFNRGALVLKMLHLEKADESAPAPITGKLNKEK